MVSVTETLVIEADAKNWTLKRWSAPHVAEVGPRTGKVTAARWYTVSYHPTLGEALRKALDESLKDGVAAGTVTTLGELLTAVNDARAACVEAGRVAMAGEAGHE